MLKARPTKYQGCVGCSTPIRSSKEKYCFYCLIMRGEQKTPLDYFCFFALLSCGIYIVACGFFPAILLYDCFKIFVVAAYIILTGICVHLIFNMILKED